MNVKTLKIISVATTLVGAAASVVANFVGGKQQEITMEETITKKVTEALTEASKKES